MLLNVPVEKILLKDIDFKNRYFEISKNKNEKLEKSIRDFGILEPPLLKKDKKKFTIVFGFNRLQVLLEAGEKTVDSVVTEEIDQDFYIKYVLLKSINNGIGPVGKIRLLSIMMDYFRADKSLLNKICLNGLNIPVEYVKSPSLVSVINNFPGDLKKYLDNKDINFKVIKNLVKLPEEAIVLLTEWVEKSVMGVNIFKKVIDLLLDIFRRDRNLDSLNEIDVKSIDNRKECEEYIYQNIFILRFPEYSSIKKKADEVADFYKNEGIKIDFPGYFEGDSIDLTITIKKRSDFKSIKNRFNSIEEAGIKELLDML